jgi:hypothetical protein
LKQNITAEIYCFLEKHWPYDFVCTHCTAGCDVKIMQTNFITPWSFSQHCTVGQSVSKPGQNCFASVVMILLKEIIAAGFVVSELTYV